MGMPVVTVASGGLAVIEVPGGVPVSESTFGIPVTKVVGVKFGLGVAYVSPTGGAALTPTTWNPADKSANMALSNGNLTATSTNWSVGVRSIKGQSAGKFYWEATMTTGANGDAIGLGLATASLSAAGGTGQAQAMSGNIWVNGGNPSAFPAVVNGNIIGIAVDLTGKLIWFRICPSGNWNNSGTPNPGTGVGGITISAISTGPLFPMFTVGSNTGDAVTANFGASAFSGAVPSGFTAGWPA